MESSHTGKKHFWLRLIGTVKLISAVLLLGVAFGLFHLLGKDVGDTLEHYVRLMHLDSESTFFNHWLAKASGVSDKQLKVAGTVTIIYAVLYIVEGIGLVLVRHWAEYLTIVATSTLIPVEIYELVRKVTPVRASLLVINIAVVAYLVYRVRTDRKEKAQAS